MTQDGTDRESGLLRERASSLAARPLNLLVIGDFGGEGMETPIAERVSPPIRDLDASMAQHAPVVRVRVEDLGSADDSLVDAKLAFRRLADFSVSALRSTIPALARLHDRPRGRCHESSAGDAFGRTELERAIAAALSGGSASPPAASMGGSEPSALAKRQLALVRGVPRYQSVERAWVGLSCLLGMASTAGERAVSMRALALGPRELARELLRIDAGDGSGLLEALDQLAANPETRPDLVVVDESFGLDPDGLSALRALARISTDEACMVIAAVKSADLELDGDEPPATASSVDSLLSGPVFAGLRTLRGDPRSSGLAIAAGETQRAMPVDADLVWRQSPAIALCEAILRGAARGDGGAWLRAGDRLDTAVASADRVGRSAVSHAVSVAFAAHGVLVPWDAQPSGRHFGPELPVAFDLPRRVGDGDRAARRASLDVRTRLALTRIVRLAAIAIRAVGAPERSAVACAAFSGEVAEAVRPALRHLLGKHAEIALASSFDGPDDRTLRLDVVLLLAASGAESSGDALGTRGQAVEVRCGCYPLA